MSRSTTYFSPLEFVSQLKAAYHSIEIYSALPGDPWRDATLSADGLNVKSTPSQPIGEGDGFHCSDLLTSSNIDPTILAVQNEGLASMKKWIAAWKPHNNGLPVKTPRSVPAPPQQAQPPAFIKPINAWFKKFGSH